MSQYEERREYSGRLLEDEAGSDPFDLFERWLSDALSQGLRDATAMTLATADAQGKPSARIVLLKGHDRSGFVFYTRYSTRKGRELQDNPHAALLFHWREHDRQVRIEGRVTKVTRGESEAYFATRPRGSQLGARAASGLDVVASRDALEARVAEEAERWRGSEVPTPEDWGGYRTTAERMEFWQGRPDRLHDRLVYVRRFDATWARYRLAP